MQNSASRTLCPFCQKVIPSTLQPLSADLPRITSEAAIIANKEFITRDTVMLPPGAINDSAFGFESQADLHGSGTHPPVPVSTFHGNKSVTSDHSKGGDLREGKFFGHYRIIHEIARGGMGIVYLAEQETLKRRVALKVLRAGDGASDEDLSRFMREAKAAASLSHPNIVRIHELDIHEGQPFFTMDYIEGPSLETLSAEGRITLRQAVEITERLAEAIDYAHSHGIVHRDLKPANVIIAPGGVPAITDFGLAVNLAENAQSQRVTHSGVVMGTIPYIPPEQAAGDVKLVGPPADIYSMGAVLYEMITGQAPFSGETQFELLHKVLNQEPIPAVRLNPKIPPDLQTICQTCMEKTISRRYSTAQALANDCRAFLNGEVIAARPVTLGYRIYRYVARHRLLVGLGSALMLLFLIFLLITSLLQKAKKVTETELKETVRVQEITAAELVDVKARTEVLTASLDPGWREAFFDHFSGNQLGSDWVKTTGRHRLEGGFLVLESPSSPPSPSSPSSKTSPPSKSSPPSKTSKAAPPIVPAKVTTIATVPAVPVLPAVNVGLKASHIGDCQIFLTITIPKGSGGGLGVLISGLGYTLGGNFGYLFRMGAPTSPGVSLDKGEVTLMTVPTVVLEAERLYAIRIERIRTRLSLMIDDTTVLDVADENILQGDQHSKIGFLSLGGEVWIDNLQVFVRGTSQQMLINMLDMADIFYRNQEWDWALRMATHVTQEIAGPQLHLRAIKRGITTMIRKDRNNRPKIYSEFQAFIKAIKSPDSAYRLLPGEESYLTGLLHFELQDYPQAQTSFDQAARIELPDPTRSSFILLAKLHGILSAIGQKNIKDATSRLTRMQEEQVLTELTLRCSEELRQGDLQAVFLNEIDRLMKSGELKPAGLFLQTLPVLFPASGRDFAARYLNLAVQYQEKKEFTTALECLSSAMRLDLQWEKPRIALASYHLQQGEERLALAVMETALRTMPESLDVLKYFGQLLLDQPQLDKGGLLALKIARDAALLTKRKDLIVLDLLSRAARNTGNAQEGFEALDDANALEPSPERERLLHELIQADPKLTRRARLKPEIPDEQGTKSP